MQLLGDLAVVNLMRASLFGIACLLAVPPRHATAATPTPDELDARKAALEKKLAGQGYTVVVEPPFVVIGDEAPAQVKTHRDRLPARHDHAAREGLLHQAARAS